MEKYRCSLLGRALADCLCDLIVGKKEDLGMDESFGTEIFSIFDDVMSNYFEHGEMSSDNDSKKIASRPVYTHEHLSLVGRAVTHNRYMEDWSLEASFNTDSSESSRSMSLDHIPQALTEDATILIKLHGE
ncbi:unnamed protein product [Albugo candida]|uniref:Uncharacterized protein n=1 Tax=Albugo candida TaxID=65357 RepID=A0A024FU24_9STRA|nr:unnamed protein product [Albugo candida]|eukprot:CCI10169.1 unnamed protein product [Albugo candida]